MGIADSISLFNSTARTLMGIVVVGGLSFGSYIGYHKFNEAERGREAIKELEESKEKIGKLEAEVASKNEEITAKQKKIDALHTSLRLLKFSRRLAQVTVLDVGIGEGGEGYETKVEFVELTEDGKPIGDAQTFSIKGNYLHIDCLTVSFDDIHVEEGTDLVRSKPLCLFERAYGNEQAPDDGYKFVREGEYPTAYTGSRPVSDLEKKIWDNFWEIANDQIQQGDLAIRNASGKGWYVKVVEGKTYQLKQRATGGLELVPDAERVQVVSPSQPSA